MNLEKAMEEAKEIIETHLWCWPYDEWFSLDSGYGLNLWTSDCSDEHSAILYKESDERNLDTEQSWYYDWVADEFVEKQ